ncbi:sigma-54-dependent transcriptional regulator [Propionivibrio soli]|uniref:sigma-54-dependent transcriptional regulator n=1 Tax=Propionivibrio soli TaxID=2976531 RepID=UPI0021E92843|nr:sigma-54 dependent transcriptional regulator [Propionivibrio soli]
MTDSVPYRICLIEDDPIMGEALVERFALEGFACDWHMAGHPAMQALTHKRYHVAICDIRLPDVSGEDLFVQLKEAGRTLPPFVFVTGYGTVDRAVRLLKLGAHDYLTKPLDIHALLQTIRELCTRARPPATGEPTLGISGSMRSIEAMLPRLAQASGSVLITGESGVGKEMVARALHRLGDPGGQQPFVAVNCGALTETLLEAELFGYVKGAFTGAVRDKKGVFEQADGGTLFLDEIGEMSPIMQVKLLRAIQERRVTRVGSEASVAVSIRLVCATHQDLKKMVEEGRFREDLYYRVHVVHLHIPPLHERKEDILWLARRMLDAWAAEHGDRRNLSHSAEKALFEYPWPGNVRELKHMLERACILSGEATLTGELIFGDEFGADEVEDESGSEEDSLNEYLQACERRHIEGALHHHQNRIGETAAALKISRKNLWQKMKKLGIRNTGGDLGENE